MTLEQMQERIQMLEKIVALSAQTCGRHNCNCPGSNQIKALVDQYIANHQEFANQLPVRQTRTNR